MSRTRVRSVLRIRDVLAAIECFAPARFAESWDNVGLLLGEEDAPVRGVLVALDATAEVLTEAKRLRANLVVTHHPLIFHPLKTLRASAPIPRLVTGFVRADLALIAAHTNLDNAPGGLNDRLAEMLGLKDVELLRPAADAHSKVVTFVPLPNWERVRDAMAAAGAGAVGNYSHCSFRVRGTGTFRPLAGARPAIGNIGAMEEVDEMRLEMIAPVDRLRAVIAAMRAAHPYEEVAFDVYTLDAAAPAVAGTGRIGRLPKPTTLATFAAAVKRKLRARHLRVVGAGNRTVQRVAVCTGAGASFIVEAAQRADVYVTGDVKHHDALLARALGLSLIDPGHATAERHMVDMMGEHLLKQFPTLSVARTQCDVEPFH